MLWLSIQLSIIKSFQFSNLSLDLQVKKETKDKRTETDGMKDPFSRKFFLEGPEKDGDLSSLDFSRPWIDWNIRRCIQVASLVMDHAAIFLASTAFMLAISMNFPIPFLDITVALYFIAILLIIFANLLMPRDTSNP